MLRIGIRILLIICCSLFISCGGDDPDPIVPTITTRTLLVYLGTDNNLENESNDKIKAIVNGWDKSSSNSLLIYQDLGSWYGASPRLLKVTGEGNYGYEVIEEYDQSNSADPVVLKRVIDRVIKDYAADSYGFLVFSHASGWLPPNALTTPTKSIIIDNKDEMDIKEFASAIPDNTFDFIIFEACNMAGVEVAYELKNKTDYILASASPMLSPGFRDIYSGSLKFLFTPEADILSFAKSYFNYWNAQKDPFRSATISLIKTSELLLLAQTVKSISLSDANELSLMDMQTFDNHLKQLPLYFFDLQEYCDLKASDIQKKQLKDAIGKCLVYTASTPNYAVPDADGKAVVYSISHHCGFTTYIQQDELFLLNNEYRKLQWYKAISE